MTQPVTKSETISQFELTTRACRTRAQDLGVSKQDRQVFIQLTSHINEDMSKGYWCNPSLRLLSDEIGITAATVAKSVEVLKEVGLIRVDATREKHNNIYWINGTAIIEANEKWLEAFRGRVPTNCANSFGVVGKVQKDSYEAKENKGSEHKRNVGGLVQNKKPYYVEEELDSPF